MLSKYLHYFFFSQTQAWTPGKDGMWGLRRPGSTRLLSQRGRRSRRHTKTLSHTVSKWSGMEAEAPSSALVHHLLFLPLLLGEGARATNQSASSRAGRSWHFKSCLLATHDTNDWLVTKLLGLSRWRPQQCHFICFLREVWGLCSEFPAFIIHRREIIPNRCPQAVQSPPILTHPILANQTLAPP